MAFEFRLRDIDRCIDQLDGEVTRDALLEWKSNICNLINESPSKLQQHGFVISINGSWGSGKTTAAKALTTEIETDDECHNYKFLRIEYSFLPFGNVNESITDFFHELAVKLLEEGWLDIHSYVNDLAAAVTPANDTKYTAGLNIGIINFNLQQNWRKRTLKKETEELIEQFRLLKHKVVIVTIDDIDRLQPVEIVAILRLVEKLRQLPNVLIILPMHKKIVTNAIDKQLQLPRPIDAQAFLTKAIDAEISIDNNLETLKNVFLRGWERIDGTSGHARQDDLYEKLESDPRAMQAKLLKNDGTRMISLLCWYTFLHIAILEDAITEIEKDTESTPNTYNRVIKSKYSEYLIMIKDHLNASKIKANPNKYPIAHNEEGRSLLLDASISDEYKTLRAPEEATLDHLKSLARNDFYNDKLVYTAEELVSKLKKDERVEINPDQYEQSARYILLEFFLPILAISRYEPFITENIHNYYKLREIEKISDKIRGKLTRMPKDNSNIVKIIFTAVRTSLDELRMAA